MYIFYISVKLGGGGGIMLHVSFALLVVSLTFTTTMGKSIIKSCMSPGSLFKDYDHNDDFNYENVLCLYS